MKNFLLKTLLCTLTIGTMHAHSGLGRVIAAGVTGATAGYGMTALATNMASNINESITKKEYADATEEALYATAGATILGVNVKLAQTLKVLGNKADCSLKNFPILVQSMRAGKGSLIAATLVNAGYAAYQNKTLQPLMCVPIEEKKPKTYQEVMDETGADTFFKLIKNKASHFYTSCMATLNDTKQHGHILIGPR